MGEQGVDFDVSEEEAVEEEVNEEGTEEGGSEQEASVEEASEYEGMEEEANLEMGEDDGAVFIYDNNYGIDSMQEIGRIEFLNLGEDEVGRFHFGDVALAYEFYNAYAKTSGFSARKSKTRNNSKGERIQ